MKCIFAISLLAFTGNSVQINVVTWQALFLVIPTLCEPLRRHKRADFWYWWIVLNIRAIKDTSGAISQILLKGHDGVCELQTTQNGVNPPARRPQTPRPAALNNSRQRRERRDHLSASFTDPVTLDCVCHVSPSDGLYSVWQRGGAGSGRAVIGCELFWLWMEVSDQQRSNLRRIYCTKKLKLAGFHLLRIFSLVSSAVAGEHSQISTFFSFVMLSTFIFSYLNLHLNFPASRSQIESKKIFKICLKHHNNKANIHHVSKYSICVSISCWWNVLCCVVLCVIGVLIFRDDEGVTSVFLTHSHQYGELTHCCFFSFCDTRQYFFELVQC